MVVNNPEEATKKASEAIDGTENLTAIDPDARSNKRWSFNISKNNQRNSKKKI